jgi:ubiquinone/menaquinone biosynthesis C-methylase UbiE
LDGSIPFIDKCRERYKSDFSSNDENDWIQREKVRFELQNLFGTVFDEGTFDTSICIDVVQHVGYYESLLKEIFRITKKHLIIRTWVSKKEDKIIFDDEVNNNIYNEENLVNFLNMISGGHCKIIEKGLYVIVRHPIAKARGLKPIV